MNYYKKFIDADLYRFLGVVFNSKILLSLFLIIPAIFLYGIIFSISNAKHSIYILTTMIVVLICIYLFLLKKKFKKYTYKVYINKDIITFHYPFSRSLVQIDNIVDIGTENFGINNSIGTISTKNDKFYFPLALKECDLEYPKYNSDYRGKFWLDIDNNSYDVTLQNCPFYKELISHNTEGQA